ncbi:pantetheine-phosphate adenylyltransferase [Corynebacterium tapiri]|uniref:Phosphopantetheine adenylyltransferase n=1 Tax=Corynebacterium tapiri TaxID=1448266 RepID=A0A5C4U811_9CORY|nr:pantetheine-phosphate adenylyltransferase [Corynebacterium tapiri]TNL99821.1 pantetheine-phosphate adenylyltransferase [Corynebacterium tapiri]
MTIAVCPGSFDPVTNGHLDVFTRAARQFDRVIVLVTGNPAKKTGLFTVEERMELIREVTSDIANIEVDHWSGLLVDYTTAHQVSAIVKGLRSSLDYDYELPMAQMNRRLSGVDTLFLMTDEKFGYVSSSLLKEVAKYGGDVAGLVPPAVKAAMEAKLQ